MRVESVKPIYKYQYDNKRKRAKYYWELFGDVPINNRDEILEPFLHFPKGTYRFDIWKWFEKEFNLSIAEDLM